MRFQTIQLSLFTDLDLVKSPLCLREKGHCGSVGVYYRENRTAATITKQFLCHTCGAIGCTSLRTDL